jgi:glycosyltransferase involved in cell wall biosynthesis
MKVMIVDHNAVFASYRQKYKELSQFPDIDITVIAPKYLDMYSKRYVFQEITNSEKSNIITINPIPIGKFQHHRGLLNPIELIKYFKTLKPEIVLIDAEPECWFTAETIFLKKIFSRSSRIVLTTWMNINLFRNGFPYKMSFIYDFNYKYSLKNSSGILCYTSEGGEQLRINNFKGRVAKINWGVDLDKFKKIDVSDFKNNLNLKGFTIGYCGRLVKEKGILNLVQAVSELNRKDINLLIIGRGPLSGEILEFSHKLKIDVKILNAVDNNLMPYYYNCMDLFVLPSLTTKYWMEQFGRVIIEAMACEVPVIGSSSGEIPNVIEDCGLIFKEGNCNDLAEKIKFFMVNLEERKKYIAKAKQRIEKYFSWKTIAGQIYDFLKK